VVQSDEYLAHLDADSARLAEGALGGLDRAVPPCPGWTVRDAVVHTGEVFWHKTMSMRLGDYGQAPDQWPQEPAVDEDPVTWFLDAHKALRDELVHRGPRAVTPTWWEPDQTVGFWFRRMAQEVVVHRADVESAFGAITPIDHDLATDGVDEVLFLFLDGDVKAPAGARGQRVAVETGGRRWVVGLDTDRVRVDGGSPADVTVSGTPSDVDLWLWGRGHVERLDVAGDRGAVDVLREWLVTATQ
jgi:uncharacterized protein (TIGR03083 family)